MAQIQLPEKLEPLLTQKAQYKILYGGRGGGKSIGVAIALLILSANQRLKILCTREIQNSIKDSVHALLSEYIEKLDMQDDFEVTEKSIRCKATGSEFIFKGISDVTAGSVKSTQGINICWVEEAQTVTARSWKILLPTIREPGSEVWITFNPDLDTDPTYVRFLVNTPPNSIVISINYYDNPWFPAELEAQRQHSLITEPDDYANIWEGKCKSAIDGAIYARELDQMVQEGRICNVPYDPRLRVHVVLDLGWNDSMSIGMVQKHSSEVRIIDYIEDSHKTLDWYSDALYERKYNWGTMYLPHDGVHGDFKTGKTAEDFMRGFGWETEIIPQASIEGGIKLTRMMLPRTYMDKEKTVRLQECLRRYHRHTPRNTHEPTRPKHDEFSHGADVLRYIASIVDEMRNDTVRNKTFTVNPNHMAQIGGGWMS